MGKTKDGLLTTFVIIVCGLAGETINIALSKFKSISFLTTYITIGTPKPIAIDFSIVNLTFGFNLKLSIFSIIGIITGIYILKHKGGLK